MAKIPSYTLLNDGILVTTKTSEGLHEHVVDYEALGHRTSAFTLHSVGRLYLALFFLLVALGVGIVLMTGGDAEPIAPVIWATVSVIFWVYYWRSRIQGKRFMSNVGTFTLLGSPSDLEPLMAEISERKIECLMSRVRTRGEMTDWRYASAYLVALRENGIVSEADYQKLVHNFDLAAKDSGRSIGFGESAS
jgi:hypothetical protein